jgi:hypothetical protein
MAKSKLRMGDILAEMPDRRSVREWWASLPEDAKKDLLETRTAFQGRKLQRTKIDIFRAAKSLYGIRCGKTQFKEWLDERAAT